MAKIKNTHEHGRATARERYGTSGTGIVTTGVMDQTSCEEPQDYCDSRRDDYSNIAKGWVRGAPTGQFPQMKNETAENYGTTDVPHGTFDKNSKTGKL